LRTTARKAEVDEYFGAVAPAMRRTAYVIVRDWHAAEDLVQTTFVKLYVAWPRIRREGLDAYARRTLVNTCLSHLRKSRWEQVSDSLPDRPAVGYGDRDPDISRALEQLPPQQRAVVALRFLDDLSVAEVAGILGVAEGTVKSQTSRALAALRTQLPDLALDEEVAR
jgi:RNA polymerase sigma-70 factor (sigma-E family)